MDTRLEKLKQMLDRHYRHFTEYFTDDKTGEEVPIEREELTDQNLSDEERQLIEEIAADVVSLSNEDLQEFNSAIGWFKYRHFDEIFMEMVRRGNERGGLGIEDVAALQELCEKGNRYAAYTLYEKYKWGNEEQRIFINLQQAKKYYDLAGDIPYKEEWDDSDDPGEENPSKYEYILTGDSATLNAVQTLINDLCQRFGTPGNEFGMFVPQRILMKELVGADTEFYRGNIMEMEGPSPISGSQEGACLVITSEADNGEPLLYALRQCFTDLNIEMKEKEW